MSFGYSAFGSQEWIRKLKPRRYFENRKTPLSENNGVKNTPDYQQLLQKQPVKLKNREKVFAPHPLVKPSELAIFIIILMVALAVATVILKWLTKSI